MRSRQRYSRKAVRTVLFWLGMGVTTAVLGHAFQGQTIETHLVGVAPSADYPGLARRVRPGQPVRLVPDVSMPAGFERVYVEAGAERIGFLPESVVRRHLRLALREGVPMQGAITVVDDQDPAHGITVRFRVGH